MESGGETSGKCFVFLFICLTSSCLHFHKKISRRNYNKISWNFVFNLAWICILLSATFASLIRIICLFNIFITLDESWATRATSTTYSVYFYCFPFGICVDLLALVAWLVLKVEVHPLFFSLCTHSSTLVPSGLVLIVVVICCWTCK